MGSSRSSATAGTAASSRLPAMLAITLAIAPLTGCPTVDLGDTPTEIGLCNPPGGLQYFQDQIWPSYVIRDNGATSCARVGCHTAGGNGLDFPPQIDFAAAYKRTQLHLNCGSPEASPFLTKPLSGIEPHGGGDIFPNVEDPAVQIFLAWFQ
jgi:hypothetical protein